MENFYIQKKTNMRALIPPSKLLCILVIWILILPATYSNANWIKTQSNIAGTNSSYTPYASSVSSEPNAPFIQKSSYNQNSNSDSLQSGVTKDWLNKLRDENGNRIMPGKFETDYIQRNTFNPLGPSEGFGGNVRSAGDVNNDGFDDIIIGALHYKSDTGRAYIYYGGTNWDTEPDVIMKGEDYSEFGGWVSSAGDVNGDGYDDVIIGASRYNSNTGRAYIFFGGASMNNIADLIMTGEAPNSYLGNSVSSAGDVNNDGFSDVIVGACGNSSITGKTFIYFGGTTIDAVADVMMNGETVNSLFGNSVSNAGDVNNDGYSDVIVGAFWYNGGIGRSYIFYGGLSMNNTVDVIMNGEGGHFGVNVSDAGDVNGDGFGDVIVGAYRYNSSRGKVYVYFGGSPMNNSADVTMTGEEPNALFGMSTSSIGDLNRDGYTDIIVGAAHDFIPADTGKAYVFFGGATMDNISDVTMSGESLADNFGVSVAATGDFNGDGYTELLVGASEYNLQRGRVYFYEYNITGNIIPDSIRTLTGPDISQFFGTSISSAGDVNKDGFDDIIIGATFNSAPGKAYIFFGGLVFDTIPDVVMLGDAQNEFGGCVSKAGDVNGDGYSDVIVGANQYNSNTGRAYVFFGGAPMDNLPDVIMTGEQVNDYFGHYVSSAGDVNKDGYLDVIVGADGWSSNRGRAYIYFGGQIMNSTADVIMSGQSANNAFGLSVSSAGDVNRDGYSDVIVGAQSAGKAYIFFGGTSMDNAPDVTMEGGEGGYFGCSVSTIGDVNGDGFSDVIVGAYKFDQDRGKVYIYFGGAAMNNIVDRTIVGEVSGALFGNAVSTPGDLNRDGYSDIIVGANHVVSPPAIGKVYIYFGEASMNTTPDIVLEGETLGDTFGARVSSGGDINGDGYPDFIVSALRFNSTTGRVYFYDYKMNGNVISDLSMSGEGTNDYLSAAVSSAGDVNGDGYDDVIIGAPQTSSSPGKAYIFFGGALLNNIPDVIMIGEATNNYFGGAVSSAGDVNNDGYDDVIVGAMWYGGGTGRGYIYFGGAAMNNVPDVIMTGEGGYFGTSVSTTGDVNGDEYSDVIVGAYRYSSNIGRTYVYFGGSTMNNVADVVMTGAGSEALFGTTTSTAGDVNGDGYSDVIVGANFTALDTGKAYIYFGGATMDNVADVVMDGQQPSDNFGGAVSSGDVNGDGFSDVIVGATWAYNYSYGSKDGRAYIYFGGTAMDANADVILYGETESLFGTSLSVARDINGDGYSDVIVGAAKHNSFTGRAYVFFGGAPMNNLPDVIMNGEAVNNELGYSVSTAGDFNKDGFSDVIAGAQKYNSNTGRAYIYLASAIGSPSNKSFRSKVSGNWNSPLTWEMSNNGGSNWVQATSTPNNTSGTITIQGPHNVTVSQNDSANHLLVESGGKLSIDTLKTLRIKSINGTALTLKNGGIISGKGTLKIWGTGSLSITDSAGFNIMCQIELGEITCLGNPGFVFNGKLSILSAARLEIEYNNDSSIKVKGDVINNGTINGSGPFIVNSLSLENNGTIGATTYFNDTTTISGSGYYSINTINSGSIVSLGSDWDPSNLIINNGGTLDISSKTLKLSYSGIPIINNGTLISTHGTIEYNSTMPQSLVTTNVNFGNLIINNPTGVTVQDNFSIPGLISIVNGYLNLNGKTITLLDTARLLETPGNTVRGNSGLISTTRYINQPDSLNIGGLGAVITSSENFGLTTITREHNVQNINPGKPGIKRNFKISPQYNTALNAHLIFKYDISELDTLNESSLGLYQTTNSGVSYTYEGGTIDTANDQIALNYVQFFSGYTAARDSGMSQYSSDLTANLYAKGKVCLRWGTVDTISIRIKNLQAPERCQL